MRGLVYFAESAGRIKIGHSTDLPKRLDTLRIGNPSPIDLIGVVAGSQDLERAIHQYLKSMRIVGEWFADCEEVRALLLRLQKEGPKAIGFIEPEPTESTAPATPAGLSPDFDPWPALCDQIGETIRRHKPTLRDHSDLCERGKQAITKIQRLATAWFEEDDDDEIGRRNQDDTLRRAVSLVDGFEDALREIEKRTADQPQAGLTS